MNKEELMMDKVIVEIDGYSKQEGARRFEVLPRKEIEKLIQSIDFIELYKEVYDYGVGYFSSGRVYAYIDAETGKVDTYWMSNSSQNHPYDDFDEIRLIQLDTPYPDILDEHLLNMEEMREYLDWSEKNDGRVEEFIQSKYGLDELEERLESYIGWLAEKDGVQWESIKKQLDELYSKEVKENEI